MPVSQCSPSSRQAGSDARYNVPTFLGACVYCLAGLTYAFPYSSYACICIYIHSERGRDRERMRERERDRDAERERDVDRDT